MTEPLEFEHRIAAICSFNRFYTQHIGLLQDGMVDSPFSLAEARVVYELGRLDKPTATSVAAALDLDPGYLSRIVAKFVEQDLVARSPSNIDRRQFHLHLTPKGRRAFAQLDRGSHEVVAKILKNLEDSEQARIVKAMSAIQGLLASSAVEKPSYQLRPHGVGDMGWVVARHAVLYGQEYGWGDSFESMIAEIVAAFLKNYDHARERCWIAEIDGDPVGSVFLVNETEQIARLRLLLVEPHARGLGIGRRLVEECVKFSRQCGYKGITLWTHSILAAARDIYERAGFRHMHQQTHRDFGPELVGETWDMKL
jgi:DNA-binding MarR family transcriptional regulator/GNAT superfamily N-acetyltransferase